jgi:mono/diheme cytochrome c family protein
MKKFAILIMAACAMAFAAEDGAALYQSKCVACHGPKGVGKPALKGTNLTADEVKKAADDKLVAAIMEGGAAKKAAHAFGKKGVTADQAKALVAHIRSLQK